MCVHVCVCMCVYVDAVIKQDQTSGFVELAIVEDQKVFSQVLDREEWI